eukprot:TRINITY_DN90030_c0_g1_i1.p1 TRINITY_DN90030_c0_g1~~TRINITY_DN90030_c0_g1_i1.p1  ORF type:complete len:296 (-),score=30.07 TRINITY_DN90030_c0_g1_i1:373-1260(-)
MPASFVTVSRAESGQKLVRFLERRVGGDIPRTAIMRWIRKGDVRVDKGRKKPFDIVCEGQVVRIPPHKSAPADQQPAKNLPPLEILFENEDIVALNKPGGLPSQGGSGHDDSVVDRLKSMYTQKTFIPAPAHRLDGDPSGVILCGKSHRGLNSLSEAFRERRADKYYLAEVLGRFEEEGWMVLEDCIHKKGGAGNARMATGEGKQALALAHCVHSGEKSLLLIKLLTGRTHQIRVQLASRGFPIIGDAKYGRKSSDSIMRLHCWRIDVDGLSVTSLPDWGGRYERLLDGLVAGQL